MDDPNGSFNSRQKLLRELLPKPERFDEAIELCLEQHALVHTSEMSGMKAVTLEDELWEGLTETVFRTMPTPKDETIAWSMWHITRIEDITMNILVAGEPQVMSSGHWLEKLGVTVCDTGNAMTDEEILDLSAKLNMTALRSYRIAVGRKTREIIQGFRPADLKRKMDPARLQQILDEGAVLDVEGSSWLVDFWGRKNVAGILLMPATRHPLGHIHESLRLKKISNRR